MSLNFRNFSSLKNGVQSLLTLQPTSGDVGLRESESPAYIAFLARNDATSSGE